MKRHDLLIPLLCIGALLAACSEAPTGSALQQPVTVTATVTASGAVGVPSTVTIVQSSVITGVEAVTKTETVTETQDASVPDVPSTTDAPADRSRKFGDNFKYADGLQVSVAIPVPFTPSESSAITTKSPDYFSFEITIKNGTGRAFDPSAVQSSLQSGDQESGSVFDSANGIGSPPSTSLLPGRSVKFKVAFGVGTPKDLVFQVTPSFNYDPAIFTT